MHPKLEKDMAAHIHSPKHEDMLIKRYEQMSNILPAIQRGDVDAILDMFGVYLDQIHEVNQLYSPSEENIQQCQHRLISINTILSIGASMAGVYALYIHSLVRRFDVQITNMTSVDSEQVIAKDMVETYCTLVRSVGHESKGEFSDQVRKLMYRHLLEPLSIEDLARELHVAPATLCRRFKAETGTTVRNAMNEQRIRLAQMYIQEGDSNITDVAFRVGFNDVSYFNKVFFKYTGQHPSEYRSSKYRQI